MNLIAGSTLALAQSGVNGRVAIEGGPRVWSAELSRLARRGFSTIDFVDAWFPLDGLPERTLHDLRSAIEDAGVRLAGVSVVCCSVIDPEHGQANLERILRSVDATACLGAPVLSIGFHRPLTEEQKTGPFWMRQAPTDKRDEEHWRVAADRVATVSERCARYDIALSLELYEGTLLGDARGALRILEDVNRENVGVNPDIGNLVRVPELMEESWRETIALCSGRINYWHLKNYIRLEHPSGLVLSTPSPLSSGEIDYRHALAVARAGGYEGPLCIEHYGGDSIWEMEQGRRYLETLLEDVA
jgi:sugar phosphate isomerase/epimerase